MDIYQNVCVSNGETHNVCKTHAKLRKKIAKIKNRTIKYTHINIY